MKKLFIVLFLGFSLFTLYACKGEDPEESTTPTTTETVEPTETLPILPLGTPQNVILTDTLLSWDAVEHAEGYMVYVDQRVFDVGLSTSFNLNQISMEVATHQVYVVSKKGLEISDPSNVVQYITSSTSNLELIRESLIDIYHPDHEIGLSLSDFTLVPGYPPDPFEYAYYKGQSRIADIMASTAYKLNLTPEQAFDLTHQMMNFQESLDTTTDFTSLLQTMDMFEQYDVTPYQVAYLMYYLMLSSDESQIAYHEALNEYNTYTIDGFNEQILELMSSENWLADYNYLISVAEPNMIEAIDQMMIEKDIQACQLYDAFKTMAYERYGFWQIYYNPTYYFDDQETIDYVYVLRDLVNLIYLDSPQFLFDFYTNQDTDDLSLWLNEVDIYEDRVLENIYYIEKYQSELDAYTIYEDYYLASLEKVMFFGEQLINSFPNDAILLIDKLAEGESLSLTEVVTLKNEIFEMLITYLPESTDFTLFYETLNRLSYSINQEILDEEQDLHLLGFVTEQNILKFLEFIVSIDETHLESYQMFIEEIRDINYSNPQAIYIVLLNIAFEIFKDYDAFVNENPSQVDITLSKEEFRPLFDLTFQLLISSLSDTLQMKTRLTAISEQYDEIYDAYLILKTHGDDFMDYLITSDGRLFDTLIQMFSYGPSTKSPDELLFELFDEIRILNELLLDDLTEIEIGKLLDVYANVMIADYTVRYNDVDYENLYDNMREHLVAVISNLITLEGRFVNQINLVDHDTLFANLPVSFESAEQFFVLVEALNQTFDQTHEDLLIDTMEVFFSEIANESFFLRRYHIPFDSIDDIGQRWVDATIQFIEDIQAVADTNYQNFTSEDEELIYLLMHKIAVILNDAKLINQNEFIQVTDKETIQIVMDRSELVYLVFEPEVSGVYELSSISRFSIQVILYDEHFIDLTTRYGTGVFAFSLQYELEAGQTYYFRIKDIQDGWDIFVDFDINLLY